MNMELFQQDKWNSTMMIELLISDKFGAMINQTKKFSFRL